ncbi:class I SAM-dependent methyltransferase [Runella limosa]|uniref:class I SAM-dependent methyltransferase n=1 Tax=Runella limosa TaxID=370978 RepID=UPI0003FDE95B|nr:class I SAM-dependent methyltransferase [Runella limosa]
MKSAAEIQAEYYKTTAENYDNSHLLEKGEHDIAMSFLSSFIRLYDIKSILDVGAGTGRTIQFIQNEHPHVKIVGIEPVQKLREIGHSKGINQQILIDGDANNINFKENSFDLVCEFGVLHHVPNPENCVKEMLRVAKHSIFISDCNNFGEGSKTARLFKQFINFLGLWHFYRYVKTAGKMYEISEGDGLYYSYSVFNNYNFIKNNSRNIYTVNTKKGGKNLYTQASHVALMAIK